MNKIILPRSFIGGSKMKNNLISKWVTLIFIFCLVSKIALAEGPKAVVMPSVAPAPNRIEDLKTQIRKTPKNLNLVIDLAQEFYNIADYEKTTLLLWKQIDKLDRNAILLLIRAHIQKNEPEQILKATQILLSKNAKDAEASTYQGRAYLMKIKQAPVAEVKRLRLDSLALESLKHATEFDPKYQPAYDELVKLYDKKPRPNYYELRLLYQDMIENIGPKFEFYSKLCEIDFIDGVNDPAIAACNKAIQLNPEAPDSYVYLGRVQKQIGSSDIGNKVLKDAAAKFSKSTLALEAYAKSMEEEKNYIEAFKYYELCIANEKKSVKCLIGASVSGVEIQKYEKSYEYLKSACEYERNNSVTARRISINLKAAKEDSWAQKFEALAPKCSGY